MRAQDLRLTYISLTAAAVPPLSRFKSTDLAELYADLCKRHAFNFCEMHGDEGAEYGNEEAYSVNLHRDRIRIEEHVQRGFDLVKRSFTDIFQSVQSRFSVRYLAEPYMVFRALWPLPNNQNASEIMRNHAVGLKDDQFALLTDAQIETVGIFLNADTSTGHFSLRITPYSGDNTQLSLEYSGHRHDLLESVGVLEQRLEAEYHYFTTTVTRFIESFMKT